MFSLLTTASHLAEEDAAHRPAPAPTGASGEGYVARGIRNALLFPSTPYVTKYGESDVLVLTH